MIRAGGGPVFLELRTYRFRAHSMYDPELYRDKEEVARWRQRDPIDLLVAQLRSTGQLDDAELARIEDAVIREIDAAVQAAEAAPLEPVSGLEDYVGAGHWAPGPADVASRDVADGPGGDGGGGGGR
jgi:pyruvate dehydrogenase E1 component alpha subunit